MVIVDGKQLGPLLQNKNNNKGVWYIVKNLTKIIIIILSLIITGCSKYNYETDTIIYNLDIDKTFKENIVFTLPPNVEDKIKEEADNTSTSLEYNLLKNNPKPIFSEHNIFYNKDINKSKDKVEVSLDYEYLEKEFDYSQYIMQCFENYNLESDKDYFEANLSGEFYCLNDKNIEINIKSTYEVTDSNGEQVDDKYTWYINKNNYQNVNIYYKLSRDYNDMAQEHQEITNNNSYDYIKYIVGIIIIIIILIILYKFYKKKNQDLEV